MTARHDRRVSRPLRSIARGVAVRVRPWVAPLVECSNRPSRLSRFPGGAVAVDPHEIEPMPQRHRRCRWWRWRKRADLSTLDVFPPRIPDGDTVLRPGQRRYADILHDQQAQAQPRYVNGTEQNQARRRNWWKRS